MEGLPWNQKDCRSKGNPHSEDAYRPYYYLHRDVDQAASEVKTHRATHKRAFRILPNGGDLFLGESWYYSLGISSIRKYPQRKTRSVSEAFYREPRLFENSQSFGLLPTRISARRHGAKNWGQDFLVLSDLFDL